MIAGAARDLRRYATAAAQWLPDGLPPVPSWTGDEVRLPLAGLAETLQQLALEGPRSFYQGGVARSLLADCATLGVPVDAADLAGYRARIMPPLAIDYRGGRMLAMPGLYAGVSLAHCLKLLQARNFGGDAPASPLSTPTRRRCSLPIGSGSRARVRPAASGRPPAPLTSASSTATATSWR